ncbi:MAG: prenyltransferase/squalene oxidase repeat-containing protein [Roseibacillus sp.]
MSLARLTLCTLSLTLWASGQTETPVQDPKSAPTPRSETTPPATSELKTDSAPVPKAPEPAPDFDTELESAITRGLDYLIQKQNSSGSWGSATKTKGLNIKAPIPGAHHAFRTGASALALEGLLSTGDRRPETIAAIAKGEAWLLDQLPRLRRAEQVTIYNNWGHAYGIRTLAALHHYHDGNLSKQAALARLAEQQVEMLYRYEFINGGWGYYDFVVHTQKPAGSPTSFTTASVLLALRDARDTFGIQLNDRIVQRALRSIKKQESPDGAFAYSLPHWRVPRRGINRPAGSLARSQACNVALRAFEDEDLTDARIIEWLDRLVKRDGFLANSRKRPIPHETHFQLSGYFYHYGHYYASEAFSLLEEQDRADLREPLARLLLGKQEKNGSWWDYPLYDYHQAYGTGYTLTALSRYRTPAGDKRP